MTAFQLTGLVELKNALPPQPPLCLLLGTVPAFFILVFFLLLALFINVRFKVGKVKVATKDFLGLLKGSVRELRGERKTMEETALVWILEIIYEM